LFLGNIAPAQGDYFQATRGGGHGDYRCIVLAPGGGQELVNLTIKAFDYADYYRIPVMILGDGLMGQMMEPVIFPDPINIKDLPPKKWMLDGANKRAPRLIASLILDPYKEEAHNWKLQRKYDTISREIPLAESWMTEDADLVVVAYGSAARIAKGAVKQVRESGLKAGLFRPITLWPFPELQLKALANKGTKEYLVFEMSLGQMIDDVKISLAGAGNVNFHGRPGGVISTPDEIADVIKSLFKKRHLI